MRMKSILSQGMAIVSLAVTMMFSACDIQLPVTSTIEIEADGVTYPTNAELYGLTIEEINHAVDGGIYGELIRNRSFEDGVPPFNCPFDPVRRVMTTPNGWTIPFIRSDSLIGWHALSAGTFLHLDTKQPINDNNVRSLYVTVKSSGPLGSGGAVAEGYDGIPIRQGEKYNLSIYFRGASYRPQRMLVQLRDSTGKEGLSEIWKFYITPVWGRYHHSFVATESTNHATLVISTDSTSSFWTDVVSLFPSKSWKGRSNGLRPDLMELIEATHPAFIRFPGGSYVEGYTEGTYPEWKQTVGDIAQRQSFWNVYAYGTGNGLGFHEYLEMCENLKAEPVFVINSGITSMSRRPRYQDITDMEPLVKDALDAISYANDPVDSVMGAWRIRHGHPAPFNLKYIEIGSENYGADYYKRFEMFKKAINAARPGVIVISSCVVPGEPRNNLHDSHLYATESFLISNYDRYNTKYYPRRWPQVFIGEFGMTDASEKGTLRQAIAEGCFLAGVETNQNVVSRVAYSPLLGNINYPLQRNPAVLFDNHSFIASPSYYLYKMFATNRGKEVLVTNVNSYNRPQVCFGRVGIRLFDNSYDFQNVRVNGKPMRKIQTLSGEWNIDRTDFKPSANHWNYLLSGDTTAYNYTLTATIRKTKGNDPVQFNFRDNGLFGEQADFIGFSIGNGRCDLFRQSGGIKDTLTTPKVFPFQSQKWYRIRIECKDEFISCYVNDTLIQHVVLPPMPSIVAVATQDKENKTIILKVINTTQHEEKTSINVRGASVRNSAQVIQMKGDPSDKNTAKSPNKIVPINQKISFAIGGPMIYKFPPNSITIMKLRTY